MIEREKLQHLIENIGIPKLCLILLLGISLIIVSIPSGKTKKNAQSTETTTKEDSTDLYVKKQEKRLVNALKHVEGVGGNHSSPRITWVTSIRWSSTMLARW